MRQVPLDEPEATSELQELREQVSALAARLERVEQAVFQKT
ncbi:hypothetical protein ACIRST_38445 [Kitasatospora sp. NPDC101447]